jgi:hypothetical protein
MTRRYRVPLTVRFAARKAAYSAGPPSRYSLSSRVSMVELR